MGAKKGKLTKTQHTQRKAHGVVFVRDQEEHAVSSPTPDKHIRHDPRSEMVRMNRNRANPVQRHEIPRQRSTHGANMNSSRGRRMAEIRPAQITKVEDEQEEGEPEVGAREQVDKAKQEQIVGYEVGT
jgi:hypothetical protein